MKDSTYHKSNKNIVQDFCVSSTTETQLEVNYQNLGRFSVFEFKDLKYNNA